MPAVTQESLGQHSADEVGRNMGALAAEAYPGRFVGAGINESGDELHIITAIMGRSASSQTRTYELAGDSIKTVPSGEKVDPLTVYRTMTRFGDWHIASNGEQTDAMFDAMFHETTSGLRGHPVDAAQAALLKQRHEPDPSHTPRISLVTGVGPLLPRIPVMFSIIRDNPEYTPEDPDNQNESQHRFYRGYLGVILKAGTGRAISTYETNADPLPPFEGEPRPISVGDEAKETAEMFADVLDAEGGFLVSTAVKAVNLKTGRVEAVEILNKYGPSPNYPTLPA